MIGFYINGRLGNQMFQLACAYTLAVKHKTNILPDETSGKYHIHKYFKDKKLYPWHWKTMHIIGNLLTPKYYHYYTIHILPIYYSIFKLSEFNHIDYMNICYNIESLPNNTRLNGYFQSEFYFSKLKNNVRSLFEFKDIYIEKWNHYMSKNKKHSRLIAIHIRLSDFKNLGHLNLGGDNLVLSCDYYLNILKKENRDDTLIMILSDEPNTVREWFQNYNNIVISEEESIIDLITLTKADVCILSHSTFSWWGAWLNNKPDKKIYVPKYFLGYKIQKEIPQNIIPANWIQVEQKQ
jgi:hypothetical protein